MRPVNLIPPEERRDKAAIRTGPMAYLLVGALALVLGGVTMVVLTNNKISDRKSELASLSQQEATAKAQADQLAPFAQFGTVEQQRTATVTSLADSRFDWKRVMRELARVIPSDVWLTNLSGSVAGASAASADSSASSAGAAGASIDTSSIAGPSLQVSGCAAGQESVASFLSALRDIDGVTRVGLSSSEIPDSTTGASASASSSSSSSASQGCSVRNFIAEFRIVVAFDAVPAPQIPGAAPTTPSSAAPASTTSGTTTPTGG